MSMSGRDALAYLKDLCAQIDMGAIQRRLTQVAIATSVPMGLLIAGCAIEEYGAPLYGVEFDDEICTDGFDNDYDGLVDCDDPMCSTLEFCLGCHDGYDNNDDGAADCSDETCRDREGCLGSCDDGIDNDDDGHTDCRDTDCAGLADCS